MSIDAQQVTQWLQNTVASVEAAHDFMDAAGVDKANGYECNDPKCNSHLSHRVSLLIKERDQSRELAKNTSRDLQLAQKEIVRLRSAIEYLRWLTTDERTDPETMRDGLALVRQKATEALEGTLK